MNLKQIFLTKNECYIKHKKHTVKGLMLHSTGANNPYLKRYISPNDDLIGNPSTNHWNQFRPNNRQVCVHGFIGKLADGNIATYQTLPWDIVGWHSGTGIHGSANYMGYIGIEICEDDLNDKEYFDNVYKEAVELFAYLCNTYKLDPLKNIICHCEGHKLGIASNHADVMHWFSRYNKNMDTFRHDVNKNLKEMKDNKHTKIYHVQVGAFSNIENANNLADKLNSKGFSTIIKEEPAPNSKDDLITQATKCIEMYNKNSKNEIFPPIQENKSVYYTETKNGTRQIFMPVERLNIDIFDRKICNNSFKKYKYAVNGTLFGGTTCSVTPLMVNGNYNTTKCRWGSNHGIAQSCIIIYRDNTVEMHKLNSIADLGNKLFSVKHIIGGVGLINKKDKDFVYNPESEGYTNTTELTGLERKCNKTVLAYIEKTNQIVLMTRENIHHTKGYSLLHLCKDCDFTYAISLDGSGSSFMIANGEYKLKGDGRGIYSVLFYK